jgi:hypothetical protein
MSLEVSIIVKRVLIKVSKLIFKDLGIINAGRRLVKGDVSIKARVSLVKIRLYFKYIVRRDNIANGVSGGDKGYRFPVIKVNDLRPFRFLYSYIDNFKLTVDVPYPYTVFVGIRYTR